MTPLVGFLAGFAVTVVLLLGVMVTGTRSQRRRHIPLVGVFFVALAFTIWQAELVGTTLDVRAAGAITPVHLFLAKLTTFGYLAPVVTGLLTLRNPRMRRIHRPLAWLLFVLTLVTVVTGVWMGLAAPPA